MNMIAHRPLEICTIADGDYAIPSVVMLTSAKVNKAPESRYRAHLMLTSPNPFVEKMARELNAPDFELIIHHVKLLPAEQHLSENRFFGHISGTTLVRCRLGTLLPEASRVLYLDGDILIRADLSAFFSMDMEGKCIAGVWDIGEWDGTGTHSRRLVGANTYVNAGVLLMNLEQMRRTGVAAMMEAREENLPPEWQWADQDIINACCPDEAKIVLPPRYNCMLSSYERHRWDLAKVNEFFGTRYSCFMEMEADSLIVHLAGPEKPWNLANCYAGEQWMCYYNLSPLGGCDWQRELKIDDNVRGCLERMRSQMTKHLHLFGFLPLLTIRGNANATRVRLFGFVPLLKITRKPGRSVWLLFHVLPILRVKTRIW